MATLFYWAACRNRLPSIAGSSLCRPSSRSACQPHYPTLGNSTSLTGRQYVHQTKFTPSALQSEPPFKKVPEKTKAGIPKENIYTIPNALTTGRLILSPYIGYLIVQEEFTWALGTLVFAGLTDLVDGFVARRYNMKTFLGTALDPAADKVLMTVLTVSLMKASLLPVSLGALIIGRDVGLILGTAWYRYKSLPPPKTFSRYFDLSLPSAEVRPPFISKLNTLMQLALMSLTVAAPVFGFVDWVGLEAMRWIVAGTTIWSGAIYALDKNVIKVLPQKPQP
ncbi:hypothetical protein HDU85_000450 [Gaertneriomyces sp. JEL0708]|nr:hypothetical protein HDU85_000450 [Gaertneriomyces sp. JEL0708]